MPDLVSYDCIFSEFDPEMVRGVLSKIDESKNQKVLWNAEQMQVVVVPFGSSSINLYIPFPTSPMY
jgi:hypothetical protein